MRFALDTNILVYAADREAGERHGVALGLIERSAAAECVLTLQSLGEFFHVTVRKGILKPSDAISWVGDFRSLFVIEAADVEVLGRAMALTSSHRISFWDALIFATVRQAGCGLLLSEDLQDRQRIDGIQIINPFTGPLPAVLEGLLDSRSDQADDSRA